MRNGSVSHNIGFILAVFQKRESEFGGPSPQFLISKYNGLPETDALFDLLQRYSSFKSPIENLAASAPSLTSYDSRCTPLFFKIPLIIVDTSTRLLCTFTTTIRYNTFPYTFNTNLTIPSEHLTSQPYARPVRQINFPFLVPSFFPLPSDYLKSIPCRSLSMPSVSSVKRYYSRCSSPKYFPLQSTIDGIDRSFTDVSVHLCMPFAFLLTFQCSVRRSSIVFQVQWCFKHSFCGYSSDRNDNWWTS